MTTSEDGESEVIYDLSMKKKVKVGVWPQRNLLLVHIREYYQNNYGQEKPGKTGITLTV